MILEESLPTAPGSFDPGARQFRDGQVDLIYSAFNRLTFKVETVTPGFMELGYPYSAHWKASVDGHDVRVYRANGATCAIRIPPGVHEVGFRYWSSAAACGVGLSLLTATGIGIVLIVRSLRRLFAVPVLILVVAAGAAGYGCWVESLYSGKNLETHYHWDYRSNKQRLNLAYRQTTIMSSQRWGNLYPHAFHRGKGVDGHRAPGSGFSTLFEKNPYWTLDLDKSKLIQTIVIYESLHDERSNRRPLLIQLSHDGETSASTTAVTSRTGRIQINLPEPVLARYIVITTAGNGRLTLDEVEVYQNNLAKP